MLSLLVALGGGLLPGGIEPAGGIRVAAAISNICALLFSIAAYRLLCPAANRFVGLAAALTLPLFVSYMRFAHSPLTEMLFSLGVAATLVLLVTHLQRGAGRSGWMLGVCCALLVLTRQAGLFVLGFCVLWIAIDGLRKGATARIVASRILPVVASWSLVYGIYAGVLFVQTGEPPTSQWFRQGAHRVSTANPRVLAIIDAIEQSKESGYFEVYRARRMMRRLLPDSSEMYEFAGIDGRRPSAAAGDPASDWLVLLVEYSERVEDNLRTLYDFVGPIFFSLFGLAVVSSFFSVGPQRGRPPPAGSRGMLGAFVCFYLLGVSILTSLVSRYVEVIIPFAILHVAAELWRQAPRVRWLRNEGRAALACAACLGLASLAIGHRWDDSRLVEYDHGELPYEQLAEFISPDDGVMTPSPLDAYLVSANWRILPNDSAERVLSYAQTTRTRWLLVARAHHNENQIRYYRHKWYLRATEAQLEEVGFEQVARLAHGRLALYRIPTEGAGTAAEAAREPTRASGR